MTPYNTKETISKSKQFKIGKMKSRGINNKGEKNIIIKL